MRGPIRKFSVELLRGSNNNNKGQQQQVRGRGRGREIKPEPAAERRPSLDKWKKVLFSQASRLSPKNSSAGAGSRRSAATTLTAFTSKPSPLAKKTENAIENTSANDDDDDDDDDDEEEEETQTQTQTQTQTPPPRTPSTLSFSGSFSIMSSDFLSRENELLGGSFESPSVLINGAGAGVGDIDLDAAASAFPDISLDGLGDIPSVPTQQPLQQPLATGFRGFGDFESAAIATPAPAPALPPAREVKVTGDDEIERFEDQFPDIGPTVASPPPAQQPTFGAAPPFAPRPQPSALASTPILQGSLLDEDDSEPIRIWREKQAEEIKRRDEASAARRQETIAKAQRSIDQFYEEYNIKKERNIKENKIQEQEYQAARTDALSAGTTWSRICDFIDLQNSQSKTLARTGPGTTDLIRFKEVLLRLKREGVAAPGAAGY